MEMDSMKQEWQKAWKRMWLGNGNTYCDFTIFLFRN